jgi:tetratricopeptide (TPR) repeat protein
MQVGTDYSLSWLAMLPGTATSNTGGTASSSASLFGPPAQVTINDNAPTVTGFRDYTQLGQASIWQPIDLASVLNPAATGVPTIARSPEEQKADEAAVKQAFDYINQGQYDAARTLMNDLLSENKTDAAAVQALGYADLGEGKYAEAEQRFLKAHALNPTAGYDNDARNARILQGDDDAVLARARSMIASSIQRDEGIRILITLTQRSPNNADAHTALGDALLSAGEGPNGLLEFSSAIRAADSSQLTQLQSRLGELAEQYPSSAFIQQLIGKTQLHQGRYADAVVTLTRAMQMADSPLGFQETLAEARVGVGRQLLEQGDVTGALASFEQAKELDPTGKDTQLALAQGYVARADQYARRSNYAAAATDYSTAAGLLAKSKDEKLAKHAAAGAYAAGRSLERARIAAGEKIDGEALAYQAAYDLDPDNVTYQRKLADTRNAIGDELFAAGKYKDAAQAYARAHELFEYDRTYRQNTINAYVAYGDERLYNLNYTDAIEAYRAAFKVDTTDAATKQKLATAYNARGLSYVEDEEYAKAAVDFRSALLLFPDNAEYQANYNSVAPWDS